MAELRSEERRLPPVVMIGAGMPMNPAVAKI